MDEDELRNRAASLEGQMQESSPMAASAVVWHELFQTLQAAGFTPLEALWIVGYLVSGGAKSATE